MDKLGTLWYRCLINSVVILQVMTGYLSTMITDSQRFMLNEGEAVSLLCEFHLQTFNLFDYPILWWKYQFAEKIQINIMGNVNEPFVKTKRFEVNFSQEPPLYRLQLIIRDVVAVDSGNYTCEVRGPSSVVLSSVTHYVYVRAPVESLTFSTANITAEITHDLSRHPRKVTMVEYTLNYLSCTAQGGYPPPQISIRLGQSNLAHQFSTSIIPVMTGEFGLRLITYTTQLSTNRFIPKADNDGEKLKCTASIPGYRTNSTGLRLAVNYVPKIICHGLGVFEWERNAKLRCEIWSKPQAYNIYWIIDHNGTRLTEGETTNGYWIIVEQSADETYQETNLYIRHAQPYTFRTYTVVAENSIGVSRKRVQLYRKERPVPIPKQHEESLNPSKQSGPSSSGGLVYRYTGVATYHTTNMLLFVLAILIYINLN